MTAEGKEKQSTLDRATIFDKLADLEEKQKKLEERVLKTEVLVDTLSAGYGIICTCLESGGLMKNGEPLQPAAWKAENIKWVQAEGARGKYQRYPPLGQAAESTDDYKALLRDLKKHDGKMTRDGYFIWLFGDSATIGRKRKGKETKATSPDIEAVKAKFPTDLADLLTFTVEGQFVVLKPKKFLGSENFTKIVAVVREVGGEYISAGKQSHFRIPKKK